MNSLRHYLSENEDAILALLLCAIDREIGGILLHGREETVNEAAVRYLADLLPPLIEKRCCHPRRGGFPGGGCQCNDGRHIAVKPRPLVILPADLRAEDFICNQAEATQVQMCPDFCPNLIAAAHQGVLYVPKINHLETNLRQRILAAFHDRKVRVEWQGEVRYWPCSFLLVASIDSVASVLSPQELDCFGLYVNEIKQSPEVAESWRVNSQAHTSTMPWLGENPYELLSAAKELLSAVQVPAHIQERLGTFPGPEADKAKKLRNTLRKAACSMAALRGEKIVSGEDVERTAKMVLPIMALSKRSPSQMNTVV
jgi:magnesium chelatase subunit D